MDFVGLILIILTTLILAEKECSILEQSIHEECITKVASEQFGFKKEILGYVTPWNGKGYDNAVQFAATFTYIVPVWLQIRRKGSKAILDGLHDIDLGWVKNVRKASNSVKILPRVMFEMNDLRQNDVSDIMHSIFSKLSAFDGIVLEIPVVAQTVSFIQQMGMKLGKRNLSLMLVMPPHGLVAGNNEKIAVWESIEPFVDRFSLNMYDYSGGQVGPNSPMPWVKSVLQVIPSNVLSKTLMGIPFYGYDNAQAIVSSQFFDIQQSHKVLAHWDSLAQESFFTYNALSDSSKHTVYFPTVQFLQQRLELSTQYPISGISIWEIGQGFHSFLTFVEAEKQKVSLQP